MKWNSSRCSHSDRTKAQTEQWKKMSRRGCGRSSGALSRPVFLFVYHKLSARLPASVLFRGELNRQLSGCRRSTVLHISHHIKSHRCSVLVIFITAALGCSCQSNSFNWSFASTLRKHQIWNICCSLWNSRKALRKGHIKLFVCSSWGDCPKVCHSTHLNSWTCKAVTTSGAPELEIDPARVPSMVALVEKSWCRAFFWVLPWEKTWSAGLSREPFQRRKY